MRSISERMLADVSAPANEEIEDFRVFAFAAEGIKTNIRQRTRAMRSISERMLADVSEILK